MQIATRSLFTTISTEGAILPADLLQRIREGRDLEGLRPEDYHLAKGERLNEAINRAWNRCLGAWHGFEPLRDGLPEDESGTSETRERWLLILFQELGYGRLRFSGGIEAKGERYAVSHSWGPTPIHLVTFRQDLDRRGEVVGARSASPHSLVQELLNRDERALWGFVSNGMRLRILRDNASLTRAAFLEFDLEAMMSGEQYSDFSMLWLLCHQSRVEAEPQSDCWLERWSQVAAAQGVRALDVLRDGVEQAIATLGGGFLSHPANVELREALSAGVLDKQDYYRQLLRMVYRLIFLFVAEDRDLLLLPDATPEARRGYSEHYSLGRLRELAGSLRGGKHGDLFRGLRQVLVLLREGYAPLGLPALGGLLFSERATPDLDEAELANGDLLAALRVLAFVVEGKVRRGVDFRNLGAEELGSIYESLLELQPVLSAGAGEFGLETIAGSERKTTGSYYTPTALIQVVLDHALDPVVDERLAATGDDRKAREDALLELKVIDPACGSGHFLVAAAHRLARHLARVRTGDDEPSPAARRDALRDVVRRCIYGIDVNEMSLELCQVALWMETLDPGKPLGFLGANLQHGDSLIGATPAVIAGGIPDDAFSALEGDDRKLTSAYRKRNKQERFGQLDFFTGSTEAFGAVTTTGRAIADLGQEAEDSAAAVERKAERYRRLVGDPAFLHARLVADTWCAAFFWLKSKDQQRPDAITDGILRELESDAGALPGWMAEEVESLRGRYGFLHWHLAFPQVLRLPAEGEEPDNAQTGLCGGFDVVLGNPPWDTMSPDDKEFFSAFDPQIRFENRDGQQRIMDELLADEAVVRSYRDYRRDLYGRVHFIKQSRVYRLFAPGNLGKGDFNLFRFFVERALDGVRPGGYASQIVPDNLYGGANCMAIRQALLEECNLALLLGFENHRHAWFDGIDTRMKFAIYAAQRPGETTTFRAAFNIRSREELAAALAGGTLRLPVSLVREFSPDALAVMELGSQLDIDITEKMYARWPKFGDESAGPPYREYMREIDMGNDRDRFSTESPGLPLYEGRMVAQYDHRAKGYVSGRGRSAVWDEYEFGDPRKAIQPQWWIAEGRVPDKARERVQRYRIGFCDVASPTNERSLVAAVLPPGVMAGHKVPSLIFDGVGWRDVLWIAVANTMTMDFLVRRKVGLSMTFSIMDTLPFPTLRRHEPATAKLIARALRLTCTSPEMTPFWNTLAEDGWVDPHRDPDNVPGILDEDDRLDVRAQIDTIVARDLYGLTPGEMEHVLGTFPIVERREIAKYGEFRSKRLILEYFESLRHDES